MNYGGIQTALLNTLHSIDCSQNFVTIRLEKIEGGLINKIPNNVNIICPFGNQNISLNSIRNIPLSLRVKKPITWVTLVVASIYTKYFHDDYLYKKCFAKMIVKVPETKYDLVISYGEPSAFCVYYTMMMKHKKSFLWIHGDVEKLNISKNILRAYKQYDGICCVSSCAKEAFIRKFPSLINKTEVRYTHINEEYVLSQSKEYEVKASSNVRILTVARLADEKGIDIIIKAAYLLRQNIKDFVWVVCGGGPNERLYQNMVKEFHLDNIFVFTGFLDNPFPYYLWANLYVQPSRSEGYCLSLAEAKLFSNLFIVSTNFPSAYEHITNDQTGIVVDMNEYSIVDAILKKVGTKHER